MRLGEVKLRIEDKWDDGILYHIEFQVSLEGKLKNIRKNLVFPEELDGLEIEKLVKENFNLVTQVKSVEYGDEILLLKKNKG